MNAKTLHIDPELKDLIIDTWGEKVASKLLEDPLINYFSLAVSHQANQLKQKLENYSEEVFDDLGDSFSKRLHSFMPYDYGLINISREGWHSAEDTLYSQVLNHSNQQNESTYWTLLKSHYVPKAQVTGLAWGNKFVKLDQLGKVTEIKDLSDFNSHELLIFFDSNIWPSNPDQLLYLYLDFNEPHFQELFHSVLSKRSWSFKGRKAKLCEAISPENYLDDFEFEKYFNEHYKEETKLLSLYKYRLMSFTIEPELDTGIEWKERIPIDLRSDFKSDTSILSCQVPHWLMSKSISLQDIRCGFQLFPVIRRLCSEGIDSDTPLKTGVSCIPLETDYEVLGIANITGIDFSTYSESRSYEHGTYYLSDYPRHRISRRNAYDLLNNFRTRLKEEIEIYSSLGGITNAKILGINKELEVFDFLESRLEEMHSKKHKFLLICPRQEDLGKDITIHSYASEKDENDNEVSHSIIEHYKKCDTDSKYWKTNLELYHAENPANHSYQSLRKKTLTTFNHNQLEKVDIKKNIDLNHLNEIGLKQVIELRITLSENHNLSRCELNLKKQLLHSHCRQNFQLTELLLDIKIIDPKSKNLNGKG